AKTAGWPVSDMAVAGSHDVLVDLLENGSDAPALWAPEDDRPLSYRELAAAVDELARRLSSHGVGGGDRVALAPPPGPGVVELLLAITALGAAAAPLNPAYGRAEFAFYLEDLEPRALLLPGGELEAARTAAQDSVTLIDVAFEPGGPLELSSARGGGGGAT